MQYARKFRPAVPVMAAVTFAAAALWHAALILTLRGTEDFAGLHFFWTAVLGLGPFVCIGLVGLLADRFLNSNRLHSRLVWAAVTAGLSPWLIMWPLVARFGLN
jgi:hypothetical protein